MTKLIIFDFWGTLVDNVLKPSPLKQAMYILRVRDPFPLFVLRFEEALMLKNYDNLQKAFENVCDEFNTPKKQFIIDKLIGLWNKQAILSKIFDDTIEVLEELKKDYKLVLLSNTDNFSLNMALEKYDLAKYFDKMYLSCDTGLLKTKPQIFEQILDDFDLEAKDAVMVGDSMQSDIQGAMNANIKGILVDRNDRRDYDPKILSLKDLRGMLR